MRRLALAFGGLLIGLGVLLLALTPQSAFITLLFVGAGGGLLAWSRRAGHRARLVVGALLVLAYALRLFNLSAEVPEASSVSLQAGQYTASSDDLLRLVTVRVVVRAGGALIFAEAHAPPLLGFDRGTLQLEPRRALFFQSLPASADPTSDPVTARLVRNALSKALSGASPREDPVLPPGARAIDGKQDTYWGMFPSEFDHRCDLSQVADGAYEGTSSNPSFPATVRIRVQRGRLVHVDVLKKWSSGHGEAAFRDLPKRMVEKNEVAVDAVSGATRSSLILRSAVFHACRAARRAPGGQHER